MSEQDFIEGERRALLGILAHVTSRLQSLDGSTAFRDTAAHVAERQEAIAKLREVCAAHGDNDWPDDLNLADVIEKHLFRHLEDARAERISEYPEADDE